MTGPFASAPRAARAAALTLLAAACAPAARDSATRDSAARADSAAATAPAPNDTPAPAPWGGARLGRAEAPAVYRAEWRRAANRATCAPLAFRDPGVPDATPRRATFSGGWAVAYDRPDTRSAFGVAGTGSAAADSDDAYPWPDTIRWADGSHAGYGPEGGSGPNELAYLYVAGQGCAYNVWSRLGRDHLLRLLSELRFVATE